VLEELVSKHGASASGKGGISEEFQQKKIAESGLQT